MNWFTRMKVGSKLVLGFLAVSMMGAVIGLLGIVKASQLSDLASLMYEREMVGGQYISVANIDLIEATRSLRSAMLAGTEQDRSRLLQDMQKRLDEVKTALSASEKTFFSSEGKAKIAETRNALLAYEVIAKQMASMLQSEPLPEMSPLYALLVWCRHPSGQPTEQPHGPTGGAQKRQRPQA